MFPRRHCGHNPRARIGTRCNFSVQHLIQNLANLALHSLISMQVDSCVCVAVGCSVGQSAYETMTGWVYVFVSAVQLYTRMVGHTSLPRVCYYSLRLILGHHKCLLAHVEIHKSRGSPHHTTSKMIACIYNTEHYTSGRIFCWVW